MYNSVSNVISQRILNSIITTNHLLVSIHWYYTWKTFNSFLETFISIAAAQMNNTCVEKKKHYESFDDKHDGFSTRPHMSIWNRYFVINHNYFRLCILRWR